MTDKQARLILQAYKPGVSPATDAEFASALDYLHDHPELERWFQAEQARDQSIRRKLEQSPVPEGLLDSILKGQPPTPQERALFIPWRPWALAASILFLLGMTAWLGRDFIGGRPSEFVLLQREMAGFLSDFPKLDVESERLPEIERWLHQTSKLPNAAIPTNLRRFPGIGCRTIPWNERELALVCFTVEGEIVHLIMFPSDRVEGIPDTTRPALDQVGRWTTASWNENGVTYMALTRGDALFAEKILSDG